jgi:hypothetical protein
VGWASLIEVPLTVGVFRSATVDADRPFERIAN